jgi:hypothetical protein
MSAVRAIYFAALMVCIIPASGSAPNSARSSSQELNTDFTDFIATSAPIYQPLAGLRGQERFPKGAQLLLIHAGKAEPLVSGFAATADANVSFDGKAVLFAGKQAATDPWQIWELDLASHSVRQLIASKTDTIRPFYLPYGRLVYAERMAQGFELKVAGKDGASAFAPIDAQAGSTVLPLSHLPSSAIPADVLVDGRILFEAGFPLGSGSTPDLFLVYSDGSGVEAYRCDHGRGRWGGKQLASGDVVFTHGTSLARFTSPLAHETPVAVPHAQYAGAIAETASGAWLVSARTDTGAHYALDVWKPGMAALQPVLARSGENLMEPVLVAPRTRPNRHPSGLHAWSYANMLALDARLSRAGDLKITPAMVRLETLDAQGHAVVTGTAPVEADGSFFLKVPGDKPIRFALLDSKGTVVRQEHGWFWIRNGEQRICVGCHTGPERASENRVPAVLLRTTTPFDLSGAHVPSADQPAAGGGN